MALVGYHSTIRAIPGSNVRVCCGPTAGGADDDFQAFVDPSLDFPLSSRPRRSASSLSPPPQLSPQPITNMVSTLVCARSTSPTLGRRVGHPLALLEPIGRALEPRCTRSRRSSAPRDSPANSPPPTLEQARPLPEALRLRVTAPRHLPSSRTAVLLLLSSSSNTDSLPRASPDRTVRGLGSFCCGLAPGERYAGLVEG